MQNCWDVYFCFLELGVLVITILQGKEMPAMDSNGEFCVEITRSSISNIKRTESTLFWGRNSLVNMSCTKCDGSERRQYKCGEGRGMKTIKMKRTGMRVNNIFYFASALINLPLGAKNQWNRTINNKYDKKQNLRDHRKVLWPSIAFKLACVLFKVLIAPHTEKEFHILSSAGWTKRSFSSRENTDVFCVFPSIYAKLPFIVHTHTSSSVFC